MVNFYTPAKKKLVSQKLTVTVTKLDAFGQGVANHNGKTIFVKSALPDETVDIQLTEDKKNYAKAKVIKYHNYSHQRVKPQCQYYTKCGGCELQHISSTLQQQAKYEALIKLLQKEAGVLLEDNLPNIIADQPYHYRRRARLSINLVKGELFVGFRQSESNQIVNIENCPILVKQLNDLLIPLQSCLRQIKQKKTLGHIELIAIDSGIILVLRHTLPLSELDSQLLIQFAEVHNISLYFHGDKLVHVFGTKEHYYLVNQLKLTFSPLDLFCGMGNFSLPMATICQSVTGIEGVEALVEKAKFNTKLNKDKVKAKTQFFTCNLEDKQQSSLWNQIIYDKILLDPARAGAYNASAEIVKISPSKLVYISCNPATLARDCKLFIEEGYNIAKIAILDMFPQTKHIESMLMLTKSG